MHCACCGLQPGPGAPRAGQRHRTRARCLRARDDSATVIRVQPMPRSDQAPKICASAHEITTWANLTACSCSPAVTGSMRPGYRLVTAKRVSPAATLTDGGSTSQMAAAPPRLAQAASATPPSHGRMEGDATGNQHGLDSLLRCLLSIKAKVFQIHSKHPHPCPEQVALSSVQPLAWIIWRQTIRQHRSRGPREARAQ